MGPLFRLPPSSHTVLHIPPPTYSDMLKRHHTKAIPFSSFLPPSNIKQNIPSGEEKEGSDFLCHLSPLFLPRFVILNAHPLSPHLQSNSPLPNRVYYVVYVYTYPPPPLSISPMQSVTTTLPLSLPSKHGNFLRPLSTLHKPPSPVPQ